MNVVCQHFASAAERPNLEDYSQDFDTLLNGRDDPSPILYTTAPYLNLSGGYDRVIVTFSED
jgi:hypothetical protein